MTLGLVFALGLLVGLLIGVVLRDAFDLYRAAQKERSMHASRGTDQNRLLFIGLLVTVALNAVIGFLLITTRAATYEYTTCTAQWQQQFSLAYTARVDVSNAVADALETAVRASDDPERYREARLAYIKLRDQQKATQARNPLPPLPETLCGKRP